RFSPREVALGIDSGDGWVEVRDGLAEGDRVVTSGQFLIDSESKLREAVQKMLAAQPAAEDEHEGHTMPTPDPGAPSDPHAGHDMPGASDPHAGHTMPEPSHPMPSPSDDPHAGHAMPDSGHAMDPHAGHEMSSDPATSGAHEGHPEE
ncbi:MAG: hypothetical protein GWN46_27505, partial [Gammaproteobacteria bacterium]|nr:hypothetical protein [Gammaproteobacteria bacterium]